MQQIHTHIDAIRGLSYGDERTFKQSQNKPDEHLYYKINLLVQPIWKTLPEVAEISTKLSILLIRNKWRC